MIGVGPLDATLPVRLLPTLGACLQRLHLRVMTRFIEFDPRSSRDARGRHTGRAAVELRTNKLRFDFSDTLNIL